MKEEYIQIIKASLILIGIIIFIFCAFKLSCFYIPFLIGYILASLFEPIIKFISKRTRLGRKSITIIVLISTTMVIFGFFIWGLINLSSETNNLLNGLNNYIDIGTNLIKEISNNISNITKGKLNILETIGYDLLNLVTEYIKTILTKLLNIISSFPVILVNLIITILATYFIASDKFYILDIFEYQFSKKMIGKLVWKVKDITKSLGEYIKAEIILSLITFVIVLIALNIFYILKMKIEYPILTALFIGFIDLLPIFGAGFILIPWSISFFISKEFTFGFWILALYLIVTIMKQLLEPKLISKGLGIHPFFTLVSMYTGFRFLGLTGLIIGPITLIILKHIFSDILDKGVVNTLTD